MFGIEDISKNAEFRELPNGYSYRILDLDWDGFLCTVDFELRKDEDKPNDSEEHGDVMDDIINDILGFDYFVKMNVEIYNPDYCVEEKVKSIYRLNFSTEKRKLHPIILLKRYCNGHKVAILSGDLKDSTGVYMAKLDDIDDRGYIETATIGNKTYNLKDYKFVFLDGNIQLSWESVMKD